MVTYLSIAELLLSTIAGYCCYDTLWTPWMWGFGIISISSALGVFRFSEGKHLQGQHFVFQQMIGTVGAVCFFFGTLDALWLKFYLSSNLSFRVACGTVAAVMSMASGMAESELFVDGIQIPCFMGVALSSVYALYRGYPSATARYCLLAAIAGLMRDLLRLMRNRRQAALGRRLLLGLAVLFFHSAAMMHRRH